MDVSLGGLPLCQPLLYSSAGKEQLQSPKPRFTKFTYKLTERMGWFPAFSQHIISGKTHVEESLCYPGYPAPVTKRHATEVLIFACNTTPTTATTTTATPTNTTTTITTTTIAL